MVGSLGVCRFKFIESLIVIQMVPILHASANILHVCIHKDVFTIEFFVMNPILSDLAILV